MPQISLPREDIDDGTGIIKPAYMAQCSCGGDIFYVFIPIEHVNMHFHFQCANCEQTYCHLGICQLTKLTEVTHE